jgi:hypothetical protein
MAQIGNLFVSGLAPRSAASAAAAPVLSPGPALALPSLAAPLEGLELSRSAVSAASAAAAPALSPGPSGALPSLAEPAASLATPAEDLASQLSAGSAAAAPVLSPGPSGALPSPSAVGAFITPQSFVAFPVASGLVALASGLAKVLLPAWGASNWVPAVIAFVVGGTIFLITVSQPEAAPRSRPSWAVALVVAFFNSLLLLAAALGMSPK